MKEIELTPPDERGEIHLVNIDRIKEWLTIELERFGGVIYTAETLSAAKQDRNALNQTKAAFERTKASIRQRRKQTTDPACLNSLNEAESQVNELIHMLERPIMLVQDFIDYCSEERRDQRRRELTGYARSEASRLGKLGEQIVLKSEKAFDEINFLSYEVCDNTIYYAKRKARDDETRKAFNAELEKEDLSGLFMRDIIREEVMPDDARLR